MINYYSRAALALLFTISFWASAAHAQEEGGTVTVDVQMPCGVAGTPPCAVEIDSSSLPSPVLSASEPTISPDFSIISIVAPSLTFTFPFQNVSCSVIGVSRTVLGRSTLLTIDYCKVANVINDVASILAYFLTAGYLIHLAFKPRGE